MLLHNLCINPITVYCNRFLEISLHIIMIFMTMILDRKKHLHPQRFTSEIGRRGIRRNGMFIFNQIIMPNIPLDTSSTQLNSTQRCFYCQILAHHSTTKSTNYYTSVGKYYKKYNLHVKRLHIMWPVPDNGSWKPQRVCGPLVWYKSMVQKGALCNRRTTPISKGGYDSCKNR